MTAKEAEELQEIVLVDATGSRPYIQRIGNGEHVVIVDDVFLWTAQDWVAYQQARECKPKKHELVVV